ncbi:MAG: hypothetical protein BWY46_01758 [Firmicutes bacterium ADurb.Bin300]|nr:MAG: hypothetical protein BWY46_01758 [Firmicutes bacterium ADurb.Bin300]
MTGISFYLLTDTHYFEPSLGASGKGYDEYMKGEQMCLAENSAILKATFAKIAEDENTDFVIIPGDLTKNGEKESHKGLLRELYKLRDKGKKIYVITARHDFNDTPRGYKNDGFVPVEGTKRRELSELYKDFGYETAIAFDERTLSYVSQLNRDVRLLAINCDGETDRERGSIDGRLMEWIKEQARAAKKDGCFMFAINHYPVIPPIPVFSLVGDAKLKNWKETAETLPDLGINLIFTGHMHIQSVNEYKNKNGRTLYDICTSALVGSPAVYRRVSISQEGKVSINTLSVPDFEWDLNGLTARQYFDKRFFSMIQHRINKALSGKGVKAIGRRIFNSITLKCLGRLLFIKVPKPLKKQRLADFASEIGISIFAGDMPYTEGTPKGDLIRKTLKRLCPVIRFVERKLSKDNEPLDLTQMLLSSVGKTGNYSDNHTVINLKEEKHGYNHC